MVFKRLGNIDISTTVLLKTVTPVRLRLIKLYIYIYIVFQISKQTSRFTSGVALLSKTKPLSVQNGMGKKKHDGEGRSITAEVLK